MIDRYGSAATLEHAGEHRLIGHSASARRQLPRGAGWRSEAVRASASIRRLRTHEVAKVSVLENRPRGNPPTGWYADVRINSDFTQVDPNPALVLDTYVICTT